MTVIALIGSNALWLLYAWLAWPAKKDSRWKLQGPFGGGDGRTVAQLRAGQGEDEA